MNVTGEWGEVGWGKVWQVGVGSGGVWWGAVSGSGWGGLLAAEFAPCGDHSSGCGPLLERASAAIRSRALAGR